jgi:hypothetical protein
VRGEFPPLGIDRAKFPFIDWNSARGQQPKKNPCQIISKKNPCHFVMQVGPFSWIRSLGGVPTPKFNFPRSTFLAGAPAGLGVQTIEKEIPRQYKTYEKTAHQ